MTSWAFPLASCRTMPLIQKVFFKTHNNFTAGPVNDVKLLLIQRVFLKTHDPGATLALIRGVFFL